eukprot:Gb_41293 [translate_table: standard]
MVPPTKTQSHCVEGGFADDYRRQFLVCRSLQAQALETSEGNLANALKVQGRRSQKLSHERLEHSSLHLPWSWLPARRQAAVQKPNAKPSIHDIPLAMALAEVTNAKILLYFGHFGRGLFVDGSSVHDYRMSDELYSGVGGVSQGGEIGPMHTGGGFGIGEGGDFHGGRVGGGD